MTLEDVAQASGASRATVSRVINGDQRVDPRTVAAVEKAIARLGYVSNHSARALAGGSSRTIGLVFVEPFRELFRNSFWGELVDAATSVFWQANYQVAFLVDDHAENDRVRAYLRQRHVDAVVVMSIARDNDLVEALAREGLPCVVFGTPPADVRAPAVDVDNSAMGDLAARRFLELGVQRPVVIAGRGDMVVSDARVQGFLDRVRAGGLDVPDSAVAYGDFREDAAAVAMQKLLAEHPDLDAVFAASDRMALGALGVLHDLGRAVPADVKVIGVDGSALGDFTRPRLTSVASDREAIGRALAELTLKAIRGEEPTRVTYLPHLVVRESG